MQVKMLHNMKKGAKINILRRKRRFRCPKSPLNGVPENFIFVGRARAVARATLNPSHVAEVHAVREQLVLRIHAQSELHAAGIIQLIDVLEEQVAAFALH